MLFRGSLGESGLVDTVVDVVVGPVVDPFDLVLHMLGKQVDLLVLLRQYIVEFGVEHANDIA